MKNNSSFETKVNTHYILYIYTVTVLTLGAYTVCGGAGVCL